MLPVLTLALAALSDCPAADAVETKLQALRSPGATGPRYTVEVSKTGASLLLTARDASGSLRVQRELPAAAPCAELEDAAAVVLLAWEAQLQPGEVPIPDVPVVEHAVMAAPASQSALAVRVTAAGQAWLSSASPTWGATAAVELHGRWLGVELAVTGQGRRELPLSTGRAMWSRFSVSLGPVATVRIVDGLDVTLGAALIGGPFWVTGLGFDSGTTVLDWDLGASAQVKVMLPTFWKLRPYVAAGGVLWARRHIVEARTPDAARVIPFLEASPTVGLVFTP